MLGKRIRRQRQPHLWLSVSLHRCAPKDTLQTDAKGKSFRGSHAKVRLKIPGAGSVSSVLDGYGRSYDLILAAFKIMVRDKQIFMNPEKLGEEKIRDIAAKALGCKDASLYDDQTKNDDIRVYYCTESRWHKDENGYSWERIAFVNIHNGNVMVTQVIDDTLFFNQAVAFATGMQHSSYCLRILAIHDWPRAQRLLGLMDLPLFQADHPKLKNQVLLHGETEEAVRNALQLEPITFCNVDLNYFWEDLIAARYFHCFDYQLLAFDLDKQQCAEEVHFDPEGVQYVEEDFVDEEGNIQYHLFDESR